MADPQATVASAVRARMDEFTPAERRVARVLLADYPSAGLSTASELASLAATSAPSVVRFATRLGMDGFADLQQRLRSELRTRSSSPASRLEDEDNIPGSSRAVQEIGDERSRLIASSFAKIPRSEIDAAVKLLTASRSVLLSGGYFSHIAARYFQLHLALLRPRVVFLSEPTHRDLGFVLDVGKQDVVVLFDFRRYEPEALDTALEAKKAGARIIVFTDEWLSPVSAHADVVLPVSIDVASFDSFVACFALVESLIPLILSASGGRAFDRLKRWESTDTPLRRGLIIPDEGSIES